eukprot:s693_g3.t1
MSILSVLALLGLKGCEKEEPTPSTPTFAVVTVTMLLGLACVFFWKWLHVGGHQVHEAHEEPHAEPPATSAWQTMDEHGLDEATQLSASMQVEPPHQPLTEEHYKKWFIQRCARRRDATADHDRKRRYEERVTILCGFRASLQSPHEGFRVGARRTLANISDISDDEESPNFRSIEAPTNLGDAQRAYGFIRSLQAGASSSTAFSTNADMVGNPIGCGHVDMFADALMLGEAFVESDDDSSGQAENQSEQRRRYLSSGQDEVSDAELWVVMNFGEEEEDFQSEYVG